MFDGAQNNLKPLRIFVSYAQKDIMLRDRFLARIYDRSISDCCQLWHDDRQRFGVRFDEEIAREMAAADVILLLVTPAFLESHYCMDIEVPIARLRQGKGTADVVAVHLYGDERDPRLDGFTRWSAEDGLARPDADYRPILDAAKRLLAARLKCDPAALAYAHQDFGIAGSSRVSFIHGTAGAGLGLLAARGWSGLCAANGWSGLLPLYLLCVLAWWTGAASGAAGRLIGRVGEEDGALALFLAIAFAIIGGLMSALISGTVAGLTLAITLRLGGWPYPSPIILSSVGLVLGGLAAFTISGSFATKRLRMFRDIGDPAMGQMPARDVDGYDPPELATPPPERGPTHAAEQMRLEATEAAHVAPSEAQKKQERIEEPGGVRSADTVEYRVGTVNEPSAPDDEDPRAPRLKAALVHAPGDSDAADRLCAALRSVGGEEMYDFERIVFDGSVTEGASLAGLISRKTLCVPLLSPGFTGLEDDYLAARLGGEGQSDEHIVMPVLLKDVLTSAHRIQALPRAGAVTRWLSAEAAWRSVALALRERCLAHYMNLLDRRQHELISGEQARLREARGPDHIDWTSHLDAPEMEFVLRRPGARRVVVWHAYAVVVAGMTGAVLGFLLGPGPPDHPGAWALAAAGLLASGYSAAVRESSRLLDAFEPRGLYPASKRIVMPLTLAGVSSRFGSGDRRLLSRRMKAAALRAAGGWLLGLLLLAPGWGPLHPLPILAGMLGGLLAYGLGTGRVPLLLRQFPEPAITDISTSRQGAGLHLTFLARDKRKSVMIISAIDIARALLESGLIFGGGAALFILLDLPLASILSPFLTAVTLQLLRFKPGLWMIRSGFRVFASLLIVEPYVRSLFGIMLPGLFAMAIAHFLLGMGSDGARMAWAVGGLLGTAALRWFDLVATRTFDESDPEF